MSFKYAISNEQAFRALVSGESSAALIIIQNFLYYIRGKAGLYVNTNDNLSVDYNDLCLVGHCALINAIKMYRGDQIPFVAFATVVIRNAMLNVLKQERSPTASLIKRGISLDERLFEDNNSLLISDVVTESCNAFNLGVYKSTEIGYFEDLLPAKLNELECNVLARKLQGYSFQEIRESLNVPKRKLDAAIARLKLKFFDEND